MKSLHLSIMVVLLFAVSPGFSQNFTYNGYIVTNSNDTIQGYLDLSYGYSQHEEIKFSETPYLQGEIMVPYDIKAYGSDEVGHFRTFITEDLQVPKFFEVYVEGSIDLLRYENRFFILSDSSDEVFEFSYLTGAVESQFNGLRDLTDRVTVNYFKEVLFMLTSSTCDRAEDYARRFNFSERDLIRFFERYYSCSDESATFFRNSSEWIKIQTSIFAGYQQMNVNFSTGAQPARYLNGTFDPSQSFLVGAQISLTNIEKNPALSYVAGLTYAQSSFTSTSTFTDELLYPTRDITEVNDVSISFREINIPIGLKYNFTYWKIQPYFTAGVSASFLFDESSSVQQFRTIDSLGEVSTEESENEAFRMNNYLLGGWGGLGLERVSGTAGYFIELRFQQLTGLAKKGNVTITQDISSSASQIQLRTGISF